MDLLVLQHIESEGPAVLGAVLHGYGHRLRTVRLYAGASVPADLDDVAGVISMGGPMNVDQAGQYPWLDQEMQYLKAAHEARVPIVGVCLGAQLIAAALGGEVAAMAEPEIGWYPIKLTFPGMTDSLMTGMAWESAQFHLHGQEVAKLPAGAVPLAGSERCGNQAFRVGMTTYGFQYHFEWDRLDLREMVKDPFIGQAGLSRDAILKQGDGCYDEYRRLGDRLCHAIVAYLFPIDKR